MLNDNCRRKYAQHLCTVETESCKRGCKRNPQALVCKHSIHCDGSQTFALHDCAGLWHLSMLQAAGYGSFRVELVDEPAEQVQPILEAYRDAMTGERSVGSVWKWLGTLATRWGALEGVTAGSLEVKTERSVAVLKPTAASRR